MEITAKVVDKQTIFTLTDTKSQTVIEETTIERVQQTIANIKLEIADKAANLAQCNVRLAYQEKLLVQLQVIKPVIV